jgi:hypothetical protein
MIIVTAYYNQRFCTSDIKMYKCIELSIKKIVGFGVQINLYLILILRSIKTLSVTEISALFYIDYVY